MIGEDPDPGGPKTYGSYGSGTGSATLVTNIREMNHCPIGLQPVLRIRIGFNADPDPDLCPDSDPI